MTTGPKDQERMGNGFSTIFEALMSDKHTIAHGIVTSFDKDARTVTVQPVIKRLLRGETEARLLPSEEDIPVIYPGSKDYELRFDLSEGDKVVLLVSERSIDEWLEQGDIVEPSDPRRFDLSDAVVLAGLTTRNESKTPIEPGITLGKSDDTVSLNVVASQITAKVDEMAFEVTTSGVRAKPIAVVPANTDVKAYQAGVATPPGIGPGYVSLLDHTHQVVQVAAPTGPAIPTELGTP